MNNIIYVYPALNTKTDIKIMESLQLRILRQQFVHLPNKQVHIKKKFKIPTFTCQLLVKIQENPTRGFTVRAHIAG